MNKSIVTLTIFLLTFSFPEKPTAGKRSLNEVSYSNGFKLKNHQNQQKIRDLINQNTDIKITYNNLRPNGRNRLPVPIHNSLCDLYHTLINKTERSNKDTTGQLQIPTITINKKEFNLHYEHNDPLSYNVIGYLLKKAWSGECFSTQDQKKIFQAVCSGWAIYYEDEYQTYPLHFEIEQWLEKEQSTFSVHSDILDLDSIKSEIDHSDLTTQLNNKFIKLTNETIQIQRQGMHAETGSILLNHLIDELTTSMLWTNWDEALLPELPKHDKYGKKALTPSLFVAKVFLTGNTHKNSVYDPLTRAYQWQAISAFAFSKNIEGMPEDWKEKQYAVLKLFNTIFTHYQFFPSDNAGNKITFPEFMLALPKSAVSIVNHHESREESLEETNKENSKDCEPPRKKSRTEKASKNNKQTEENVDHKYTQTEESINHKHIQTDFKEHDESEKLKEENKDLKDQLSNHKSAFNQLQEMYNNARENYRTLYINSGGFLGDNGTIKSTDQPLLPEPPSL